MSNYIYVVERLRWGGEESHHYVIGVYSNLREAVKDGIEHHDYRGGCGKYQPRIIQTKIDSNEHNTMVHNIEQAHALMDVLISPVSESELERSENE